MAGRDQLEEQVRRFGFEGDVADLIDAVSDGSELLIFVPRVAQSGPGEQ
jgi:hypothetical protein